MLKSMRHFFAVMLCFSMIACSPVVHQRTFYVFGTIMTVTLTGVDEPQAQRLLDALGRQAQDMHDSWHAWQRNEVEGVNLACETGQPLKISDDLRYLLVEGQKLESMSEGYFNPAMGKLIHAWGFLSNDSTQMREPPTADVIDAWLRARPSMANLSFTGDTVSCNNPAVRIDMGAYAKGYALTLFMDYLKVQGVRSALINVGGDLFTLGDNQGKPWRIAIRSPWGDKPMAEILASHNESIVTSGVYERAFKNAQGEQFHHVINPKTGQPGNHFVSVTVMHADPMVADAAATALLVSDQETWIRIAQKMGISLVILVDKYGKVSVSESMQERITWFETLPTTEVAL